ncbi:MAG: radical SAM family heme chaperone HemW [bacterium]
MNQSFGVDSICSPEIGLYIHVPFCDHICGYCDFYKLYRKPESPIYERFTRALIQEVKLRSERDWGNRKIGTTLLGGGTPSYLATGQLERIFAAISAHFDISNLKECTIEINPGTVDTDKLRAFRQMGISRASFGVQAFQDHVLKAADRIHDAKLAVRGVEQAFQAGFTNINVDLLYGIPGQAESDWQASLRQAVELPIQHISLYNLTYEKGTPFYHLREKGTLQPVREKLEQRFYDHAIDYMEKTGFHRYEVSNYARPGFDCLHNLGCWNLQPYLGMGPSAHSFDCNKRFWNSPNLNAYIRNLEKGHLAPCGGEILTEKMRLEEWVSLRLRQVKGIVIGELKDKFGIEIQDWRGEMAAQFGRDWNKWLNYDGQSISLTEQGFWLSDEILPKFLQWLQPHLRRTDPEENGMEEKGKWKRPHSQPAVSGE